MEGDEYIMDYIYVDQSPDTKYQLYNYFDQIPYYNLKSGGSYHVSYARLLGISYPNYLRLCRDEFGATLIGKDWLYICPKWDNPEGAKPLARMLNARLNLALKMKQEKI
jgi:hypothetical protein